MGVHFIVCVRAQTATDGLQAAAESLASLSTSNTRDADGDGEGGAIQNPDHLLALLYGLKGESDAHTHTQRETGRPPCWLLSQSTLTFPPNKYFLPGRMFGLVWFGSRLVGYIPNTKLAE